MPSAIFPPINCTDCEIVEFNVQGEVLWSSYQSLFGETP